MAPGNDDDDDALLGVQLSEEERYKDCDRFKFKCPGVDCGREIIIDGVFTGTVSLISLFVVFVFRLFC